MLCVLRSVVGLKRSRYVACLVGSKRRPIYCYGVNGNRSFSMNANAFAVDDGAEIPIKVETLRPSGAFPLLSEPGVELPPGSVHIKYASIGDPSLPTVLLMPSMSNNVWAIDGVEDGVRQRGWWRRVVGYGIQFGINLENFHVICGAAMGAPFGSTSPLTPKPDGSRWRSNFPQITPQDMALHQKLLMNELGYEKVHAIVGGSMGGMQVIQFACNFPDSYSIFASVAATAQTSPGTVALRSVQRKAVRMDQDFMDGDYEENPTMGMGLARMFGTICYRSPVEFDERFDWRPNIMEQTNEVSFEVERYLQHAANKFTRRAGSYDANCWLLLSQAMDMQDVGKCWGSFSAGVARVPKDKQGMLLSYTTDRLTPAKDHERLATAFGRNQVPVHFESLESPFGHDAFLIEDQAQPINLRLRTFLNAEQGKNVNEVRRLVKELYEH